MLTDQEKAWTGEFGDEYTARNYASVQQMDATSKKKFGLTRWEINRQYTRHLKHDDPILEVGCNIGNQLISLQSLAFTNLHGIDIQIGAVAAAIFRTKDIIFLVSSAYNIPYPDNYFEMVFTSGLLIHISPDNIAAAMTEIARCSRRYIWGYESYAETYTEVEYRGHGQMLWKTDFARLYCDTIPGARVVRESRLKHPGSDLVDTVFLIELDKPGDFVED